MNSLTSFLRMRLEESASSISKEAEGASGSQAETPSQSSGVDSRGLKAGDVLVVSMQAAENPGSFNKVFRWGTQAVQGGLTHAAIYVGNNKIVEARLGEGVTLKHVDDALQGKSFVALRPQLAPSTRKNAAEFAKKQVGKDYDDVGLAMAAVGALLPESAAKLLDTGAKRDRESWVCANLVTAAYAKARLTTLRGILAPADLRTSPKMTHVKTVVVDPAHMSDASLGRLSGVAKVATLSDKLAEMRLTPAKIHAIADQRGVKWDNDTAFMDNCEKWTGKRHLDAMSPAQLAVVATALEKRAEVEYHGKTFPGYNKPIASDKKEKKMMVLAKKGDEVKLVHFGQKGYQHNYNPEAKQNYLTRSAGIRNKSGQLTKDDPFSPNYWARKVLWPKGETGHGHNGPVNTEVRMQRKEAGLLASLIERKEDEKLAAAFKLAEDAAPANKKWSWKGFREGIRDEGIPMAGMVGGAYLGNRLLPGGSGAVYGSGIGYGSGALANLGLEHALHKKQQAKTASDSNPSSFIPGAIGATLGAGIAGGLTKEDKNKGRNMLAGSAIGYGLADAGMLARELIKKRMAK
jgi:hypothetical protein